MTTALNKFISRSADRCRPFFQLLHKWKGFEWNEECALAFQQLKECLSRPPIMSQPKEEEVLFAYIVVASHAVNLVLVRVENGVQRPVYYVSKSLHEAKVRYLPLEKAILVVVHITRKLPHYFQAHTVWGLDIVGPFPKAVGNQRWLLVGTNYFKKWVEAEPLSNIRDLDAKKFVWKNIVTQFGIPYTLISDNRLQFDSKAFRRYCCELGIRNTYSTLVYPQGNEQAEPINKVIVNGLKKMLDEAKGR
ncbi:uncharacterized protein LOC142629993 [Castanea sativa]|uniref:uncharacterized protein LOC142629993 n=1 Tax=Castanea sativa TaxID=21020 RepID=UPI003F64A7B1